MNLLEPRPFDIRDPLPTGTTVLEASAGTGKTYTVGALVTRYVAEGRATLEELLVVTFGRAASQELRERVREQLVAAERALADPDTARIDSNDLIVLLAEADGPEVALRRQRLRRALADFDAATIATTHQFCQQVLTGLGVAGDSEPGATLVEDLDDLVVEVVDDLYVRRFGAAGAEAPQIDRAMALELGRRAVGDPGARLEPAAEPADSLSALRFRFAGAVRAEVDRRKRQRGLLGYDDLLSRLADALEPAGVENAARMRMQDRWKIVLIDEFQDTDPVQWDVLRLAFAHVATLLLIGDPKQAIYAFRGGDVYTYLAAARTADARATLGQNWRSDAPLVAALQVLFDGAELGEQEIVVRPVRSAHAGSRLTGAPSGHPLRLRVATREQFGKGPRAKVYMDQVRPLIAEDLAADVARLLASGARFDERALVAGDVAVLVNTHVQGLIIREALAALDIPSVTAGAGSVYATAAGGDWLTLLEALEQPHRSARVRAAALTPFLGRTAEQLDRGGERLTDELGTLLRNWADLLQSRGVAALLELSFAEQGLPGRVLGEVDGERRLTDLRHLGQGLQAAAADEGLGLAALVEWLRRRRAEAAVETNTDRIRRLDSDAAAVQVMTLHVSKGLQYPVVYLPFAADRWVNSEPKVLQLHDNDGRRVLDVGGFQSTGRQERERRAAREQAGEALRLLYVGLTRGQSQVVMWWVPSSNTPDSGLHRLLFGRTPGSGEIPDTAALPGDDEVQRRLAELQARGGPAIESALPARYPRVPLPVVSDKGFAIGTFARSLDTAWRRASYSALSAAGDRSREAVASEPETGERDDEVMPEVVAVDDAPENALVPDELLVLHRTPSPMADLPAGTSFGTLVHAVLEHTDPQAADLSAELTQRSAEQLARHSGTMTAGQLAAALLPVLSTPLGPIADHLSLNDFSVADRLTELDFELPLAGGDHPTAEITLGQLAPLIRRHLPADDPLLHYADRLASPEMSWQPLRGYLTGSLDAVLRLPGPRYLIADYKTNWLGGDDAEPLSAWHYRPAALQQAMTHSDYPLQALLYSVALHRFLRWRQPGYDPDRHLGGAVYLYVRGMSGPATPLVDGLPCGVFGWRPPADLVRELSTLLDQGTP
ncbi:UvrD-helicase domain-containing protein [Nakamurella sp. PAMC28650]|uniref:UvrD-helicase domain-containing protein n=1 Tax=Nakamurella sp. PAMC28650 TaxID=2762325 RepID=UPI00164E1817|nr:UvrD-helicase domain-containing protein [Nakamurella sp. PAMC28650]QNK83515.1 UvrD-helicase domain-containing protein [Nakamurella sp. PAMC28650]